MKLKKLASLALALSVVLVTLPGCDSKGPAERAGERLDNAVKKGGDQLERAGDAIKEEINGDKR